MPSEYYVDSDESDNYERVKMFTSFPRSFPSFPELKAFIRSKVMISWPDLANHYGQHEDTLILSGKVDSKGRREILAHGVTDQFFRYVAKFAEEDYVHVHTNPIIYMMAGGPLLASLPRNYVFLFLTISIKD
jgi:hypothetical protein